MRVESFGEPSIISNPRISKVSASIARISL